MADFKAMLEAKKKAAEAARIVDTTTVEIHPETKLAITQQEADMPLVKEEPAVKPVEKPLTFQEKMALRNAAKATTTIASAKTAELPSDNAGDKQAEAPKDIAPVESAISGASTAVTIPAKEDTGTLKEGTTATESRTEDDPVIAQAYADIKTRIELLESLEDTQLEGAMKELKKALMANPNAVSLMLDPDYGKMVVALRRITKEAQVEATKEKTTGTGRKKAAKSLPLDADVLAQVFDEL